MNEVITAMLIIVSGAGATTTTTVVGTYPVAVCTQLARQHSSSVRGMPGVRFKGNNNISTVQPESQAYCNPLPLRKEAR